MWTRRWRRRRRYNRVLLHLITAGNLIDDNRQSDRQIDKKKDERDVRCRLIAPVRRRRRRRASASQSKRSSLEDWTFKHTPQKGSTAALMSTPCNTCLLRRGLSAAKGQSSLIPLLICYRFAASVNERNRSKDIWYKKNVRAATDNYMPEWR